MTRLILLRIAQLKSSFPFESLSPLVGLQSLKLNSHIRRCNLSVFRAILLAFLLLGLFAHE